MSNPISDFFSSIFSSNKSVSVLGVDIGPSSIKVVQMKKKSGRAVLETYGELSLGPYAGVEVGRSTNLPAEKLAQAVTDILRESNVTTNKCGLSIAVGSSFVSFIKLPNVNEQQLRTMIPLEARKYIPAPISEVTLDYSILPKNENRVSEFEDGQQSNQVENTIDVMLVVILNEALTRNRDIARLAKLDSAFSEIEIFSSLRAVIEPGTAPQMVIDFGSGTTKIYIVERGILRSSHSIGRGSQDITLAISKSLSISVEQAEKLKREYGLLAKDENKNVSEITALTLDYIFSEIGRSVLDYQKKSGKKINKVFLTGGGVLLKGLKEKAESSFSVAVELADPFAKTEYPAFLENVLKTAGPTFAVSIGLALRRLQELG